VIKLLPDSRVRDRIREFANLPEDLSVHDVVRRFGASAYVVESVPLALYASRFIAQASLGDVLRTVIQAGGDTDSVASMTGQVAGAWAGASLIPDSMIERLPNHGELKRITNEFVATIQRAS
jgi:ADP-ribosylglycohydrolase